MFLIITYMRITQALSKSIMIWKYECIFHHIWTKCGQATILVVHLLSPSFIQLDLLHGIYAMFAPVSQNAFILHGLWRSCCQIMSVSESSRKHLNESQKYWAEPTSNLMIIEVIFNLMILNRYSEEFKKWLLGADIIPINELFCSKNYFFENRFKWCMR